MPGSDPSDERRRRDDDPASPGTVDLNPVPATDEATWGGEGGAGDYPGGPITSRGEAGRPRDPEGNPELM